MRTSLCLLLLGCTAAPIVDEPDASGWRSALYPEDWVPGMVDAEGRGLHDMSYAGYRYGEEPPDLAGPLFEALTFGADPTGVEDSTEALQAAIDAASVSGGVVHLPEGLYRVDGLLSVRASGVVLRGEGAQTRLAFTRVEGMTGRAHITLGTGVTHGPDLLLAEDGVARRAAVRLADPGDLAVGDDVALGHVITDAFVEEHAMTGTWTAFNGTWQVFERRTVVDVADDGTVTLDVPLRASMRVRDGASLRRETGHVTEVGVEDLAVSTAVEWRAAWAQDRSHAIHLIGVADGWVRGIESFASPLVEGTRDRHLQSGGIRVVASKRITIADSVLGLAQNRGGGGNGYLYEVGQSSEVLTRDCVGEGGRHNFIQNWGFGTTGCVWLRTESRDGRAVVAVDSGFATPGYSEYHHSLATANLVDDSVADDGWQAVNRRDWSTGAGHTATESVFWNLRGEGVLRSAQWGMGYVIGTEGLQVSVDPDDPVLLGGGEHTAPADHLEGLGEGDELLPRSLYEDQRARRLSR